MIINRLQITNFRVLDQLEIEAGPGPNLIWGDNGVGKTSVLEAIYLAGRGRSFRHRDAGPFIRHGSAHSQVIVQTQDHLCQTHRLGIERGKRSFTLRLDGRNLGKRSDLLRALPVQLITPQSHELLERGPELRRRYLDFGMFHVEPGFHQMHADMNRILKQRNAALRTQPRTVMAWDEQFTGLAHELHQLRTGYLQRLLPGIKSNIERLLGDLDVSVSYRSGWDETVSLEKQLDQRLPLDSKRGYTSVGPHRAELDFQVDQVTAAKVLSRGQQKLLVSALQFAQASLMKQSVGEGPVMLIDDLPAELDQRHRTRLIGLADDSGLQCFVTAIEAEGLQLSSSWRMFHVEQTGAVG